MLLLKKYRTRDTLFVMIAFLFALHMVNFPFVQYPNVVGEGPAWYGLDVSWQMTLNYALIKKWIWGQDIVYTYGPLGFLGTRIGWGISRWWFLLSDALVVFNFFCIFRDIITTAKNKWVAITIIFTCTIAAEPTHRSNIVWLLTIFMFYWMYRSYKEYKFWYYILLCSYIAVCFFIKVNAGFIGIALLGAHLTNLFVFKKLRLSQGVIVMCMQAAMIWVLTLCLHVSLLDYIKGAIEIVKGYNDIMFLEMDPFKNLESDVTILFYCFAAMIVYHIYSLLKNKEYAQLFFAGITIVYVILLRKQAVIRNDYTHYFEFFSYFPFVFLFGDLVKRYGYYVLGITILSFFYTTQRPMRDINYSVKRRYTGQADYIKQFSEYNTTPYLANQKNRYIPDSLLKRIGNNTIDVFPWDSEYLIENKLNYKPRPVFQSFSAYTPYLELLNYEAYLNDAPKYLLYDYETIDLRYAFNDDVLLNFFICKNYTLSDSFRSNGYSHNLLVRKAELKPITLKTLKKTEYGLKEQIPVDKAMMLKINTGYTLGARLESIFYRAPVIRIKMTRSNGESVTYRVSPELLKAGIMTDRWVNSGEDFIRYMHNRDALDAFKFIEIVADSDFFQKTVSVEYINVE